jgi:hypothetical protein
LESDELGGYRIASGDGDEGGDAPVVGLIAVWAAREEEIPVDFVCVSLKLLLKGVTAETMSP